MSLNYDDEDFSKLYKLCAKEEKNYPDIKKCVAECKRLLVKASGQFDRMAIYSFLDDALHNIGKKDDFHNSFLQIDYKAGSTEYSRVIRIDNERLIGAVFVVNPQGFIVATDNGQDTYFYSDDVNDVVLLDPFIQVGTNKADDIAFLKIIDEALEKVGQTLNNEPTDKIGRMSFKSDLYDRSVRSQIKTEYIEEKDRKLLTNVKQEPRDDSSDKDQEERKRKERERKEREQKEEEERKRNEGEENGDQRDEPRGESVQSIFYTLLQGDTDRASRGKSTPIYKEREYDPEAEFQKYVKMATKYMSKQGEEKKTALVRYNKKCGRILQRRLDDVYASLSTTTRKAQGEGFQKLRLMFVEDDPFVNFVARWYIANELSGSSQSIYPSYTKVSKSRFPSNLLTAKIKSAYPSASSIEDFWNGLRMKYTEERKQEVKELVKYLNSKQRSFHKI